MQVNKFLYLFAAIVLLCSCETEGDSVKSDAAGAGPGTSKAGSMAAFAQYGKYLYVLDLNTLKVFDASNVSALKKVYQMEFPKNVVAETLYPFNGYLLVGTMQGVLIYDISGGYAPVYASTYEHVVSCDPVVASGNLAFSTLSTGTRCRGINELHILDISDVKKPFRIGVLSLSNPHGLDIDGNTLLVCDGMKGLKTIDVSNPTKPKIRFSSEGFHGYDVITTWNKTAIVTGSDGIYQFSYSDTTSAPQLISKMGIGN
jgi:hypothetical protein